MFEVDETNGDKGYAAGGGLAWGKLKGDPASVSQLVRTGKVQPVPVASQDTNVLPPHYRRIQNPRINDEAKRHLRPYALQIYDRLRERQDRGEGVTASATSRATFSVRCNDRGCWTRRNTT